MVALRPTILLNSSRPWGSSADHNAGQLGKCCRSILLRWCSVNVYSLVFHFTNKLLGSLSTVSTPICFVKKRFIKNLSKDLVLQFYKETKFSC